MSSGNSGAAPGDYLAEARKSLKATAVPKTDYSEAGRDAGKAFAKALFGGAGKQLASNTAASTTAVAASNRIERIAIGTGFFFATMFISMASVFVNGWMAISVVLFATLVCFSRMLKSKGISILVGVLLLVIGLPLVFAGWNIEQRKAELAPLRQSNPAAYLEEARGVLSRREWLAEAKLLEPRLYNAEIEKDEAAKLADQERVNEKVRANQQAEEVAAFDRKIAAENTVALRNAEDACDIGAKRQLKNSGSYSPQWGRKHLVQDDQVTIYRNFTATNGFGATIDNRYVCIYSRQSNVVTDLQVFEGFR